MVERLTFEEFASRYCKRQIQEPEELKKILLGQKERYNPDGWMLLECALMDSSKFGKLTIVAYGPNNTIKTIPDHPISVDGSAPGTAVLVAILLAEDLDPERTPCNTSSPMSSTPSSS